MQRSADNRLLLGYVIAATVALHILMVPLWVGWLSQEVEHEPAPLLKAHCEEDDEDRIQARRACRDPQQCPRKKTSIRLVVRGERPQNAEKFLAARDPKKKPLEKKPPEEEEKKKKPKEKEEVPDRFTVLTEKPLVEQPAPEKAEFAATHNTQAKEQMVARGNDVGSGKGPRRPGTAARPPSRKKRAARKPPKKPRKPRKGKPDFEEFMAREMKRASAPPAEDREGNTPEAPEDLKTTKATRGQEAAPLAPPTELAKLAEVDPSMHQEAMDVAGGGGGAIDYLNDIKEGDKTLLNRKRSVYAGFFDRVTVGIKNHWNPVGVYRQRDPTGRVYGVQDRVTVLRVSLNGDGTLSAIYVQDPSGLEFLDEEALRAVRAALPFPNPPEGLKDVHGKIHFSFGFHFEITTQSRRLFRFK